MRRKISWQLVFLITALLFAGIALFLYHELETAPQRLWGAFARGSEQKARQVQQVFADLFQFRPRVITRDFVLPEAPKPALQLALVERDTEVRKEYEQTWVGSTKRIRIRMTYRLKAGFDLSQGTRVEIEGRKIRVQMPPAQILSIEPIKTEVEQLSDGLWNRVQPQDLQTVLEDMPDLARQKETELPAKAEATLQQLLSKRLSSAGFQIEIETTKPGRPTS